MKTPDRFERTVMANRVYRPTKFAVDEGIVVRLLRRQHAAMVRLVKRKKEAAKLRPMGFERTDGYFMACDDLLAALMQWKRGTKCR